MDRKPRAEGGPYIGRPMPRFEDLRLVRGAGRYSDDISIPGQAYAVFVRSPHAHAKIKAVDVSAAKTMPGVIAVLTGADYIADGLKGAIQRANPAGAIDIKLRAFAPEKRPVLEEPQYPLATDRVRYPGEALAVVVAETVLAARDAAEAVAVDYEVLPAVTDIRAADGAETRSSVTPPRCGRHLTQPISSSSRPSSTSASPIARWSRVRALPPTMPRRIPTR
jgi:carbon-monoxide dehydrogenase large subunit